SADGLAAIGAGLSIHMGGLLTLTAKGDTDANAIGDARASEGGSDAIGAGVALNFADVAVDSAVGAGTSIFTAGLAPSAATGGPSGAGSDDTNTIGATAMSGAGGGKLGLAGSLAVNSDDVRTTARLRSDPAR